MLEDMKNKNKIKKNIQHPLFGTSFINWIKLINENGGIDNSFIFRAIFITISTLFIIPARFFFKNFYGLKISNIEIKYPPVFIIGHWRSGTTFLHELLCQDPNFCYVSLWHTLLPNSYLILEPTKKFMAQFLPSQRPMDNIKVNVDGPYEEEAGLAVLGKWSFFHCFHFPKYAKKQYNNSVHFKGLKKKDIEQWKRDYLYLIKAVVYSNKDKRIVLKNPSNTARIKVLMDLFPDALFIHICRNPYKVYLSTKKMRKKVLDKLALQNTTDEEIENHVINNYINLMESYFAQKAEIPDGHLIEVKYEDLVADPMKIIQEIYSKLDLQFIEEAKSKMKDYLEKKAGYKVNVYKFNDEIINRINKHWNFTIKRWGYKPPN